MEENTPFLYQGAPTLNELGSVPISTMPARVAISPKDGTNALDPSSGLVYVNAKQYERILKRRMQRAKWDHHESLSSIRQPFIHKSRHNQANRRKFGSDDKVTSPSEDDGYVGDINTTEQLRQYVQSLEQEVQLRLAASQEFFQMTQQQDFHNLGMQASVDKH